MPHSKGKGLKIPGMKSGALMRRDQEVKAHQRMGGKASSSRYSVDMKNSSSPRVHSGMSREFGTIGAALSRPER